MSEVPWIKTSRSMGGRQYDEDGEYDAERTNY